MSEPQKNEPMPEFEGDSAGEAIEGFEPGGRTHEPSDDSGERPDWLVGPDEGRDGDGDERPNVVRIPNVASAPPRALRGNRQPLPEGESESALADEPTREGHLPDPAWEAEAASGEEASEAWHPAASSIPKLTVVHSSPRPTTVARGGLEDDLAISPHRDVVDEEPEAVEEPRTESSIKPPDEPWWLVAIESLATNRMLQIGILAVVLLVGAVAFWPRKQNQTSPLAAIRKQPQRYEGQWVRVRGEVEEVFDIGQGFVFNLRQGRDTVVVFSPSRRPTRHDKVVIEGTVSTGYLDGVPRVAVFETATPPVR